MFMDSSVMIPNVMVLPVRIPNIYGLPVRVPYVMGFHMKISNVYGFSCDEYRYLWIYMPNVMD